MSDQNTPLKNKSSSLSEDKKTKDDNAEQQNSADTVTDGAKIKREKTDTESSVEKNASIQKAVANKKAEKTESALPKKPISKLALLAIFIAASSIAASAMHYLWQQEQSLALSQTLSEQRQQEITASQASIKQALSVEFSQQLKQQLAQQQQTFSRQLKEVAQQAHQESEGGVKQLSAQVNQLEQRITQRQPSDWLIHEAEYLIRVAARTMWLERDTKAAIGLLKEADSRLSELKQPQFLPVRALINQDVAALALMPVLENQQAILSLMALNKQITHLPLAGVNLSEALDNSAKEDLELSDDISDWQVNLQKTWQKFLKDFITVRRRTGMVEPLMAPEQQQHLKQNLGLKIQLTQWAASEYKVNIYQQTLLDIQAWMNEFFDMEAEINQKFYQALEQAKAHTIFYDYPSNLASLTAIKRLKDKTTSANELQSAETKPKALTEPTNSNVNKTESGEKL